MLGISMVKHPPHRHLYNPEPVEEARFRCCRRRNAR